MIVPGMFVCSNFLISVCMFIVSKALLISSATVIVRAGGAIWLNAFAMVIPGDDVCCSVVVGVFSIMWSQLLMTPAISCPLWSSVYESQ